MKIKNIVLIAVGVICALIGMTVLFGSWYQVDQGDRAVVLRNGRLVAVSEPGLHFKIPIVDNTVNVSVRDHTVAYDVPETYSADQQPASMRISVTYRIPEGRVGELYSQYGSIDNFTQRVLGSRSLDWLKKVFGQYTAVSAIQNRTKLGADVLTAIRESMKDEPVIIPSIQLEDISFSKVYISSIEQQMQARVLVETTKQKKDTAIIQAEIQVLNAKAQADSQRAAYEAEADGIKMRGEAEAKAIEARAKALAANTNLVQLNAVDKWDGKLPVTQVPGSTVPFINIK